MRVDPSVAPPTHVSSAVLRPEHAPTGPVPPAASAVLADHEIRAAIEGGTLLVTPFEQRMVRPASLGLRLGRSAYVLRTHGPVDTANPATHPQLVSLDLDECTPLSIDPGAVVLAPTMEAIALPSTMAGLVDGTSEVARLGLSMVLAQQVAPGFGGDTGAVLTLEIVNHLRHPVYLWPGTRLCNLMLLRCGEAVRPYSAMPFNHSDDCDAAPSRLAEHIATESRHPSTGRAGAESPTLQHEPDPTSSG